MKGYKLFMDVSGDVMADIAKGEVQLLPMEFEIGNDEYVYTGGNDGMDPVEFYKFVKQGVPMKTSQITPSLFENYFEETAERRIFRAVSVPVKRTFFHLRVGLPRRGVS